jgi:prevent-host-death family protein
MAATYTTYEAKARFSEVLRRVRAGERVVITFHGRPAAEIRPVEPAPETFEERIARLKREGRIVPAVPGSEGKPLGIRPIARRPGALKRFLDERD